MERENKNKEELIHELDYLHKKNEEYEEVKKRGDKERIELVKANRALRTLSDCNQVLVRAEEEIKFMQDICNILVTTGGYKLAWVGYATDDEDKSVKPVAFSGFEEGYLELANVTWADNSRGRGPVGTSIRDKTFHITSDTFNDAAFLPWREDAVKRGYNSVISLPLIYDEKCYGALAIYSAEINYFDDYEIDLLSELAQDLSYGITVLRNEIRRKEFEHELKISEENYRRLVEISPNAIGVHSGGKFVYVNKAALELMGANNPEDIIGTPALNIVHPDYRAEVIERMKSMSRGLEVEATEEKFIRFDGKTIDVLVAACRMTYQGKEAVQVVVNDITELKRIESDLRENEERFRTIFENAPIGMYRTSPDGSIIMANRAFMRMLGYTSPEEFLNLNMYSIYEDVKDRERLLNNLRSKNHVVGFETSFKKKDGSLINVRFNTRYVQNADADKNFLEGTVEDITTQLKIKEELITAKERAEEISRIKSNFLANMSHELRTPLVAILGFAEIFRTELEDKIHREMADSIYASGQRLLETLNSILDLSKIESNKIEVVNEELNVSKIVKEITRSFENFASKKGLFIKTVIKDENAVSLLDRQMLQTIINHLINNGIKYTVKGGITVELDTYRESNEMRVKISVKDTGIGIPSESMKIIFEEFRQVSEGLNRNFEGSGLGLTITKKFVEILNGKIFVSSREGEGTEFTVLFPAIKISEVNSESRGKPGVKGHKSEENGKELPRILLVENDQPTIDVTRIILRKLYTIDVESTGTNAVTATGRTKYDVILMDINLGAGMDGTAAMKKIREIPGNSNIPVVAFTAYAMTGDREKFLKEGFSEYIAKPFEKKTLLDLLTKVFTKKEA